MSLARQSSCQVRSEKPSGAMGTDRIIIIIIIIQRDCNARTIYSLV